MEQRHISIRGSTIAINHLGISDSLLHFYLGAAIIAHVRGHDMVLKMGTEGVENYRNHNCPVIVFYC